MLRARAGQLYKWAIVASVLATFMLCVWLTLGQAPQKVSHTSTSLQWSGYDWIVRGGNGTPGPCAWTPSNVSVDDQHRLHVKIAKLGDTWYCSELHTQMATGYGTYTWKIASDLRGLDPAAVLGLFTYDPMGVIDNSEVDVEVAKWNQPSDPNNAGFAIQPSEIDPAHRQLRFRVGAPPYTAKLTWAPQGVALSVTDGDGKTTDFVGFPPRAPAQTTQALIDLWLFHGTAPARSNEVVLSSFHYERAS